MQLVAVQTSAGKEKRIRLLGVKQTCSSRHSLGALIHSEGPLEQSIPPSENTPVLLGALSGGDIIDLLTVITHRQD